VLSFEQAYAMRDKEGDLGPVENYAAKLAEGYSEGLRRATEAAVRAAPEERTGAGEAGDAEDTGTAEVPADIEAEDPDMADTEDGVDLDALYRQAAIEYPNAWAFELVTTALDAVFGQSQWATEKRPKRDDPARNVTWVVLTNR
jgi:hypothetical protein